MPRLPDERVGPRGHPEGNDGQPLDDALSPDRPEDRLARHERLDRGRYHAPGDASRRHRRGGQPGRPAVYGAHRPRGHDPLRRPRRADHRRPRGRQGLRHRSGQDHAGPRPGRLRDRQAPRSADDHRARRRRSHQRERRPVCRAGPLRGSPPDRGGSAGPWGPRGDRAPRDDARALPALRRRGRAASQDPMVRARRAARGSCPGGDPLRQDADPAGAVRQGLGTLDDRDARLERQPPALVGSSHPGVVLPGRPHDRDG